MDHRYILLVVSPPPLHQGISQPETFFSSVIHCLFSFALSLLCLCFVFALSLLCLCFVFVLSLLCLWGWARLVVLPPPPHPGMSQPDTSLHFNSTPLHYNYYALPVGCKKGVVKMHFLDGEWDTAKSDLTGLRRRTLEKKRRWQRCLLIHLTYIHTFTFSF